MTSSNQATAAYQDPIHTQSTHAEYDHSSPLEDHDNDPYVSPGFHPPTLWGTSFSNGSSELGSGQIDPSLPQTPHHNSSSQDHQYNQRSPLRDLSTNIDNGPLGSYAEGDTFEDIDLSEVELYDYNKNLAIIEGWKKVTYPNDEGASSLTGAHDVFQGPSHVSSSTSSSSSKHLGQSLSEEASSLNFYDLFQAQYDSMPTTINGPNAPSQIPFGQPAQLYPAADPPNTILIPGTKFRKAGKAVFTCSYSGCEMVFSTDKAQKLHERYHDIAYPKKCELCKKGYEKIDGLTRHRRIHPQPGEALDANMHRHVCPDCGYTSNRPDTLKTHRRAPGACVKHTRKLAKEAREEEQKAKGGKGKGKNVQAPIRGL